MPIANVVLTNTFDEWRKTTNETIKALNDVFNDGSPNITYRNLTANVITANTMNLSGGGTVAGSLLVTGNLFVTGNTTYINVQTLSVQDPILFLASNNFVSDVIDMGFVGHYVNTSGSNVHTGLIRDSGSKEYYLFFGYDKEIENNHVDTNANNFTIAFLNSNLRSSNIILNDTNVSSWLQSSYNQANTANTTAVAAFEQANTANTTSVAAFAQANTANTTAVAAFEQANTANTTSVAAFEQANTANTTSVAAFEQANTAYSSAVLKTGNTMTGNLVMSGANIAFDTATNSGIYWSGTSFIHSPAANILVLGTSSVEDIRIDSNGRVGIGTAAPTANLHVTGNVTASAIDVAGVNVAPTIIAAFAAANAASTSGSSNNAVLKTGNTMTGNLVMSGVNIAFATATNSGIYWSGTSFIHSPAANILVLGTSSVEDIRIDPSGNVSLLDNILERPTLKDYSLVRVDLGNTTGSVTINSELGNFFTARSTGTTTWTFSNPPSGARAGGFIIELTNGGSQTQNWPTPNTKWPGGTAPTLTTSGTDVLVFITDDGGTIWRGVASMLDSQ